MVIDMKVNIEMAKIRKIIFYFANGYRMMRDYLKGEPIGKYVMLTRYTEIKIGKLLNIIYFIFYKSQKL